MSKENEVEQSETGRVWGVHRRECVPVDLRCDVLPPVTAKKLTRTLRKLAQRRRQFFLIQDKETGKWKRIFPHKSAGKFVTPADLAGQARAAGLRVKRIRPKCAVTRTETLVGFDQDSGDMVCLGEEKHTFASSVHFTDPAAVERLAEFFFVQDIPI